MKETIIRALTMWLVLFILLQPLASYMDYLLDLQVKANTSYLAQKSATEGMVTETLKNEVIKNLTAVGFPAADIHISSSTEVVQDRKTRLDVYIEAPRLVSFVFNFSKQSAPKVHYAHASIMSEFIN